MKHPAPKGLARRNLLLGCAGLSLAAPMQVRAAPTLALTCGTSLPPDNALNIRLTQAFARIAKETGGAVGIKLFTDSQLGSDTDMLSQLRAGALDLFPLSTQILSTLVPMCSLPGVGFAFTSRTQVWAAMDGELGAFLRAQIARANLFAQERIWDLSWKTMSASTRRIVTPADLKGLRLRTPAGALLVSLYRALGASPVSLPMSEVYTALQTGVVEGMEVPLATFQTAKLYEVQKHLSLTRQMWDGWWLLANLQKWNRLPANVQEVISRNLDGAALQQRQDVLTNEKQIMLSLPGRGTEVIHVDTQPFKAKLQAAGFYDDWKSRFGAKPWALLEKFTGPIALG
jgi:tripartite ATP-independent transporter DctP family solute receptor